MTTIFRTLVVDLPATPLGLLPARWKVEHYCTVCRSKVPTEDLIPHARAHNQTIEEPTRAGVP